MIKAFLLVVLFVFAILGLTNFIYSVKMKILSPKKKADTYTVIFLERGMAAEQISYAVSQHIWFGEEFSKYIIACGDGLEEEEKEQCRKFTENYNVIFCSNCGFSSVLEAVRNI